MRAPWRARLALALLGSAWVLPFLSPNFYAPISSFYGEATAIALGLAALTALHSRAAWPVIELPRAALMLLGFAGLILLHAALGRAAYVQLNFLAVLYLVWAAALSAAAWRLREIFGLDRLAATLAWCTVAGALLSAAIGLAQLFGIPSPLKPFMLPQVQGRIFANTGQANHLASYASLGVASVGFLHVSARARLPAVAAMVVPLLLVLAITGSRSVWLYLAAILALAAAWRVLRPSPAATRALAFCAAMVAGFALALWMAGWMVGPSTAHVELASGRMRSAGFFSPIRFRLWHEAWLMFLDAPLLGEGFRQFPWQHFLRNARLPAVWMDDIQYDNAHNLVMQVLAEFGLAGAAVLAAGIAAWAAGVAKREPSAPLWWALACAAILALHSMLEYPLWYAYFLGIAAVLLGATDSVAVRTGGRAGGRLVPALILVLGWVAMANTYQDYRTLQSLHRPRHDGQGADTADVLLELQQHSLFTPFVELALSRMTILDREQIADKVALNEAVMHFGPAPDVVYRQAALLALAGEAQAAASQWDLAAANYPGSRARMTKSLEALGGDPGIAALLAHARAQLQGEAK
ncbi:MAG TPA: Wzy polymerase domain-containing protein [Burkholderiales bacterium]|nr:Wzy polymerase domain-containing protein [Burkholderiales bacterium]